MRGLLLLLALSACESTDSRVFIALDSDFASFRDWESVSFGSEQIQGHPSGDSHGYLNHRTRASSYPVGTMIVKAFQPSWEIFAMAKRGGNFNSKGALNWEFFRLRLVDDTPVIVSRGIFAFDPDSDSGVGYGATGSVVDSLCNSCHGTAESNATDHILDPQFRPGG